MKKLTTLLMAGLISVGLAACTPAADSSDVTSSNQESSQNSSSEVAFEKNFDVVEEKLTFTALGEYKTLTAKYGDDTVYNVTYTPVNKTIVDVVNGVVIAKKDGETAIAATYENNGKTYEDVVLAKVTSDFKVTFDTKDTTLNIKTGDKVQVNAKVTYPSVNYADLGVNYTSSDDKVATVSESGVITAVGKGIANITATSLVKITSQLNMMGQVMIVTSDANATLTVIVDNEFNKDTHASLIGRYENHYDWQGFAVNSTPKNPTWTKDKLIWIRALSSLEFNENGTFTQQVLNAQREKYFLDEEKLADPNTKYDTYEQQSEVFKNAYVYNKADQEAEIIDGKQFGEIKGMLSMGMPNFAERGVFAIINGQLLLSYKGRTNVLGAVNDNAWATKPYVPFKNLVGMSANMAMVLAKVK